jgi:hypothetical protein
MSRVAKNQAIAKILIFKIIVFLASGNAFASDKPIPSNFESYSLIAKDELLEHHL